MSKKQWIDLRGLKCPEPVMMLHASFRQLSSGEQVFVIATDPTTQHDVPRFCQNLGHHLVSKDVMEQLPNDFYLSLETQADNRCPQETYFYFEIEKG